jgi:single-stranded-DNA-specific exonuclease
VDALERLAPFGPGNPALTLATRDVHIAVQRTLGRGEKHLRVTVEDAAGHTQDIYWWQWRGAPLPQGHFDLAYTVRDHTYQGTRTLQATWVEARDSAFTKGLLTEVKPSLFTEGLLTKVKPSLFTEGLLTRVKTSLFTEGLLTEVERTDVVDYRHTPRPRARLHEILEAREDVQVWREGTAIEDVPGCARDALSPSPALAVWTSPPSPAVWRTVIQRVAPTTLYLFGVAPGLDTPQAFLERLAGLVKHALRTADGEIHLETLAIATAQREITVRKGLLWLAAKGYVTVREEGAEAIRLGPKNQTGDSSRTSEMTRADADVITEELKALLDETAAYRRYFLRVEKDKLLQPLT